MKKNTTKSGWEKATEDVTRMSNEFLLNVWEALGSVSCHKDDPSSYEGVTMNDWAELVYSEKSKRQVG